MKKISDNLKQLYSERKRYIELEDYIKADLITKRIASFKEEVKDKQIKNIEKKNKITQEEFESSYKTELLLFKQTWEKKEADLKLSLAEKEEKLLKSQKKAQLKLIKQLKDIEEKFNNLNCKNNKNENDKKITDNNDIQNNDKSDLKIKSIQNNKIIINKEQNGLKTPKKISPAYLNLRRIQLELARQERFLEAAEMKKRAEKMRKEEKREELIKEKNRIKSLIESLLRRQKAERLRFSDEKSRILFSHTSEKGNAYDAIVNKFRSIRIEMSVKMREEKAKQEKKINNALRVSIDVKKRKYMSVEKPYRKTEI